MFNIFNVMQLLYCTKHTKHTVPEIFFLLVWCPAHTACEMSDEKRDWEISEDKSPQGNLKDTYLIIYMSQVFMRMHKHSSTRTRTCSKLCRWGGKNCCNVAIKTGVDLRSHRRGRTSVSHAAALRLIPRGWHKPVLFYHYYSDCSPTAAGAADKKTDWRRLKSHLILQHLIKGCFRIRCGSAPGLQVIRNRAAFTWVTFDGAFTFNHFKRKKYLSCKRLWQSVPCEPGLHSSSHSGMHPIMVVLCGQRSSACSPPQLYLFYCLSSANHNQSASEGNPLCVSHRCHLGLIPWN